LTSDFSAVFEKKSYKLLKDKDIFGTSGSGGKSRSPAGITSKKSNDKAKSENKGKRRSPTGMTTQKATTAAKIKKRNDDRKTKKQRQPQKQGRTSVLGYWMVRLTVVVWMVEAPVAVMVTA
jgi:hypothetical protein